MKCWSPKVSVIDVVSLHLDNKQNWNMHLSHSPPPPPLPLFPSSPSSLPSPPFTPPPPSPPRPLPPLSLSLSPTFDV